MLEVHHNAEYRALLDDIEDEAVAAVVNAERPISENRRYRLVELVADTAGNVPVDIRTAAADKAPAGQIYPVSERVLPPQTRQPSTQVALSLRSRPSRIPPLKEMSVLTYQTLAPATTSSVPLSLCRTE